MKDKFLKIEEFSYNLPDEKIAKYPLKNREDSKLLVYKKGEIKNDISANIATFLPINGLMVFNDTKVIQARLLFEKQTGAKIEIFCLSPFLPADIESSLSAKNSCRWNCIVGNARKWKNGKIKLCNFSKSTSYKVFAEVVLRKENHFVVEFSWASGALTFSEILENEGVIPIPPYLNRYSEEVDKERYQTVYSAHKGSVAAPTAGLHFTDKTFDTIKNKKIKPEFITLHVGAGTFKPIKTDTIGEHQMHAEYFFISANAIKNIKKNLGNITAVGTTSVRTIESLYWLGVKIIQNKPSDLLQQWEVYTLESDISVEKAFEAIEIEAQKNGGFFKAHTQIMITPSYTFKVVNQLITNFHQPKSTLLLLIAAFVGEKWKKIYDFALSNNYRFLSYGDSSLLFN